MIPTAVRRLSNIKSELGYIAWGTEAARRLVVAVLQDEPAKTFGLRTPAVYKAIMDRFPHEKLNYHLVPPDVRARLIAQPEPKNWKQATWLHNDEDVAFEGFHARHPAHPVRSVHYLKHSILEKMETKGQLEMIRITRGKEDAAGNRIDKIYVRKRKIRERMTTDVVDKEEWRWRLVSGAPLTPLFSGKTPSQVYGKWAENVKKKKAAARDRLIASLP